jgi:hypothetical protein
VAPAANCGRESLIAFTNGQTGATNPERQGLNAALLDGPPPLNILQEIPEPTSQFDYSPMWDVHFETWTDAAVAARLNVRQTDFSTAMSQVTSGNATGSPAGAPFGPSEIVVNCPVVITATRRLWTQHLAVADPLLMVKGAEWERAHPRGARYA